MAAKMNLGLRIVSDSGRNTTDKCSKEEAEPEAQGEHLSFV